MLKVTEKLICDMCQCEITDRTATGSGTVMGKDMCPACLSKLRSEVEEEYHRVVLHEVPTRRGGYRALGELDT